MDKRRATWHMPTVLPTLAWITVTLAACTHTIPMALTGNVQEVVVADGLSTSDVTVHVGDEIRWTNRHGAPIHLVFLDEVEEVAICNHGFGLAGIANGKRLKPNKSISLCFGTPVTIRYTVKLDRATSAGEFNVEGYVHVERADTGALTLDQSGHSEAPVQRGMQ